VLAFKTLKSAERSKRGIEIMHMTYKSQMQGIECDKLLFNIRNYSVFSLIITNSIFLLKIAKKLQNY